MVAKARKEKNAGLALGAAALVLATTFGIAHAQQDKKAVPPNPAGAGWTQTVNPAAAPSDSGTALDDKQIAALKRVSNYFSELNTLKGNFVQTNPDQKRMRGRFAVKKPGRFRFDYAPPSKQVIISDGKLLAVQDHDLGNEDVVEVDRTVFRLLLRADVDLARDARILDVQEADDLIVVSLQDKGPDSSGRIRLFLAKNAGSKPALELKEWIVTDGQGLDTRTEISNLTINEAIDDAWFKRDSVALKKQQQ
jgi:outer membrane lipoprotein-sorting protein